MTVVALSDGGLLIYNPLACTEELQDLLAPIIEQFGQPKHIVLGTVALEHKVYAGVFAQKYPKAIVYLQPGQVRMTHSDVGVGMGTFLTNYLYPPEPPRHLPRFPSGSN